MLTVRAAYVEADRTLVGASYVCETPCASFVVPSHQPVRSPGPHILEKLPFETALPKPSAPILSVPPSRYLSMSTMRGKAAFSKDIVWDVRLDGHWRKSYTSSVMIRASYSLAKLTNSWRLFRLIVLKLGFENVGTAYMTCLYILLHGLDSVDLNF
jgi:hypothetical protein